VNETVALLAVRAPKLRKAVRDAKKAGRAYVVVDGTLIPIDRVAADRPFYSGTHKKHGMNPQVIASPDGDILWMSGTLPGSVHDKKAERVWGMLAELEAAGLVTPADKGYQGSAYAKIPYKGRTNRSHRKTPIRRTCNSAHPGKGQTPSRHRASSTLATWCPRRPSLDCRRPTGQISQSRPNNTEYERSVARGPRNAAKRRLSVPTHGS
jgi:hypothetical protein